LTNHGITVIIAAIAPFYDGRDFIRSKIDNYIQVYLDTSLEIICERDTKGLYRNFQRGEIQNLVGLDIPYEIPRSPNIVIHTGVESVNESFLKLTAFLNNFDFFSNE
jgi:adenylylsulfate kinase-like enzyme